MDGDLADCHALDDGIKDDGDDDEAMDEALLGTKPFV
jgi:hypothetical protein